MHEESNPQLPPKGALKRIAICSLVLALGFAGMLALTSLKKPPGEAVQQEPAIRVRVTTVAPEDVAVVISGFGEVRPLRTVVMAAEVAGRVVWVHPRLVVGEVIPAGAELFRIDDRDYRAAFQEADAAAAQWATAIERLQKQSTIDRQRLQTLERSRELSRSEFQRLKKLYEDDMVGTRSGVEAAERAYNAAVDQAAQLAQAVALYPLQIREAEKSLAAAHARCEAAAARLERCRVAAPFRGRVRQTAIEAGQYVSPGQQVLTLADDSILEIRVPLDSRDAQRWLPFETPATASDAWFGPLPALTCTLRWTEAPETLFWRGTLDRVVAFDPQSRTVEVAVRVAAVDALRGGNGHLPLVEGMFCQVEIPGRILTGVFRLARHVVSFENTVYVAEGDRLRTVDVTVARTQGEEALISEGLQAGQQVIVTRLVDPLENSLLTIETDGDS
ncbi:MAG TPA: HlyD family efflux transporter periplasmic adaptor subunit [Desulfobacterales bacterium]|nr:HlyD family efflux transporter periplasmic adaptor subunit [Desulfobacterales bacterium]